jgi:uncharacterized protein (TIGR02996 family)
MRTFQRGDDRFWAIDRKSLSVTVAFGKVGGKAQTRKTVARPEAAARQLYQRMIRDKLADGYVETTPPPAPLTGPGKALEAALVDNPDDQAAAMALADWLGEQADPAVQARGEFARVQLDLENPRLAAAPRAKLQKREKELRKDGEAAWLGWRLGDYLFEGGGDPAFLAATGGEEVARQYRRGWLSGLELPVLTLELARVMAEAPCLRLLRELSVAEVADKGEPLAVLARAGVLGNVRRLALTIQDHQGAVSGFVGALGRVEELRLSVPYVDNVFSLRSLKHLRVLHVEGSFGYPIRELAANPSLGKLEELVLLPPGLIDDEEPYLRLASVRVLLRSKLLPSLRRLVLHRSDMGDAGCREVADSGVMGRLEVLDLTHGCVSDEGARILAGGKEFAHLKRLVLTDNRLSEEGIEALGREGLELVVEDQQSPDGRGCYEDAYLFEEGAYETGCADADVYNEEYA